MLGDIYTFPSVLRWKCATESARARTRDASLDARTFAGEREKKRRLQCRAVPSRFRRVEGGHIRQKVCSLTNLVAMATKRARGGWVALDVPLPDRHACLRRRWRLKDSVAALTLGSAVSSLKASYTCRSLTPPPRSRKLAGFPPCRSMMSHVAMAKPAPFTGMREHQQQDKPGGKFTSEADSSEDQTENKEHLWCP